MTDPLKTFLEAYRNGECEAADIDDWIERWHTDMTIQVPLREFLGLSWAQYRRWAETGRLPE